MRKKKKNGMGPSLADRTTNPTGRKTGMGPGVSGPREKGSMGSSLADRTRKNVMGPSLADRTTNPLSRPATVTGGPGVIGRSSRDPRAMSKQAGFTTGGTFTTTNRK